MHYHISFPPEPRKPVRRVMSKLKSKFKPTGELALFTEIYKERGMRCEITGVPIEFNINSFAHVLGKGAYPSFRLEKANILMVIPRIHQLYDHEGKEKLLKEYPEASVIYEKQERLRRLYYEMGFGQ